MMDRYFQSFISRNRLPMSRRSMPFEVQVSATIRRTSISAVEFEAYLERKPSFQ